LHEIEDEKVGLIENAKNDGVNFTQLATEENEIECAP
jgi:hypothetical protein